MPDVCIYFISSHHSNIIYNYHDFRLFCVKFLTIHIFLRILCIKIEINHDACRSSL